MAPLELVRKGGDSVLLHSENDFQSMWMVRASALRVHKKKTKNRISEPRWGIRDENWHLLSWLALPLPTEFIPGVADRQT